MSPDNWRHLKDVFYKAIDLPSAERDGFVSAECGSDAELEASVRRILAEHEAGAGFLENPATETLPLSLSTDGRETRRAHRHTFQEGTVVGGRFAVVRFHASGAMREVYEAYDTELRETVALKTIVPENAWDARAIERFKNEVSRARRISSEHVCRVHDLFTHRMDSGEQVVFLDRKSVV